MADKQFLEAGEIVGTHGVRGELRVYPACDSPAQLSRLNVLYLGKEYRPLKAVSRAHKTMALVKLEGIDTVEAAEALRGQWLYFDRADMPLRPGQYFLCDLIGLQVIDHETEELYGTCTEIITGVANDVYVMKTPAGREVLIPAIPSVVRGIDTAAGTIKIFAMPGLLEP